MIPRRPSPRYGYGAVSDGEFGYYETVGDETAALSFTHASSTKSSSTSSASWRSCSWRRAGLGAAASVVVLSVVVSLACFANSNGTDHKMIFQEQDGQQSDGDDPLRAPPQQQQQQQLVEVRPATHNAYLTGTAASKVDETNSASLPQATESLLTFTASNDYTRRGDVVGLGYPWLEGKILVEPYRETSLAVVSPLPDMTYSWQILETVLPEGNVVVLGEFEGDSVDVMFGKAPRYTVVLVEATQWGPESEDGVFAEASARGSASRRRSEVEIVCKYVRREIRTLLDDERNEMFDAMKVLWDVDTTAGREIYGENYVDVWSIDQFHQIGASDLDCDHFHDGIGFGITHSMVAMMFENSLQLVNPKISLPYWDFTIEGHIVETEFGGDYDRLRDASDMWTEDWFGSVDPVDFQVKDGRWAYTKIPVLPEEEREFMGADVYGRMRSPWNVLNREYMARGLGEMCGLPSTGFYKWPNCQTHYEMQEMYTSYYGYTWHSQYQPHGPVHVWIGGNLDCKKNMARTAAIIGEEYLMTITGFSFVMRKNLFRDRLFKCRGYADTDVSAKEVMESGQCGCLDLDLEQGDDYIQIYDIFSSHYNFPEFTEAEKRQLAYQYCSGEVGIGESSQSSSPLDPTFWSLHPTMERLLSFKMMTGTLTDVSWPDKPGNWTGMDGTVYDVVISLEEDECFGHRGSDVFPYGILEDAITPQFNFFGETGRNTLSNRELVHLFDPREQALPYIYDNFEWPHCAEEGFDFHDFYDAGTGAPKFEGTTTGRAADRAEAEGEARRSRQVDGYGVFEKGGRKAPLYDYPSNVVTKSSSENRK